MSVGTESSEFTLTRRRPIKSSPSTNSPNRVNEPRGKSKEPHGRAPSASTRLQFNWYTMFGVLVVCRSVFALLNLVWDCDETYNYWEPMHMLAYQSGAQTWEYSPAYALRSYFYLMINLAPIYPLVYMKHLIPHSKIVLFYAWRIVFGAIIPAVLETNLFLALKQKVSRPVALFYIGLSLTSVGMWTSLSSFLPSSFCILCVIYSYTNWINGKLDRAVVGMGVAGLIGWPFALLLGLPILIDYAFLSSRGGLIKLIRCLAIYGTTIVAVLLSSKFIIFIHTMPHNYIINNQADSFFFGRWVLAPLNIVLYNVFSSAGPDLYGVEPFSYYIKNLLLNLNLVLPLALLYVFVVAASLFKSVHIPRQLHLGFFGSLSLWLLVIGTRPHKEERFMYPVYPLFLIYAAVALDFLKEKLIKPILCHSRVASSLVVNAILAIHFLISLSRFLALYYNYSAQISVFAALNQPANKIGASVHLWHAHNTDKGFKTIHVCMGKEWYRFPSSFWLPADHEEQVTCLFKQ